MAAFTHRSKGSRTRIAHISGYDLPEVAPFSTLPEVKPSEVVRPIDRHSKAGMEPVLSSANSEEKIAYESPITPITPVTPAFPPQPIESSFDDNRLPPRPANRNWFRRRWKSILAVVAALIIGMVVAVAVVEAVTNRHSPSSSKSNPGNSPNPTASHAPSLTCSSYAAPTQSLPPSIQPVGGPPATPLNSGALTFIFNSQLPYENVAGNDSATSMPFSTIPSVLNYPLSIPLSTVIVSNITSKDTLRQLCYTTTLATVFYPQAQEQTLMNMNANKSSPLWNEQNGNARLLMNMVESITFD